MITLAQAAADALANPRPILFLDTCVLLDVIRAPLSNSPRTVQAGVEIRDLAGSGFLRLFVQDIVPIEWGNNLAAVRRDGDLGIRAYTATWQIAADLGQPAPPLPVLAPGTLLDELETLSNDLLNLAEVLDRDPTCLTWAIDRVVTKRKPSSSDGTVKDCHILGHALRLSNLLMAAAYPRSRIFISSNREDFARKNRNVFHADIALVAAVAELGYAVSLEAALADLRTSGEIP
jgi:hypothetical protein